MTEATVPSVEVFVTESDDLEFYFIHTYCNGRKVRSLSLIKSLGDCHEYFGLWASVSRCVSDAALMADLLNVRVTGEIRVSNPDAEKMAEHYRQAYLAELKVL